MSGRQGILIYLLYLAGGAGKNAVIYANVLAAAGHGVTLVCGRTGHGLEQQLDPRVDLRRLGIARNGFAIIGLGQALRRIAPSRALVIGPSNMFPFVIAAYMAGFKGPIALRVSDSPSGMQALHPSWVRWLKRHSFRYSLGRADRLIALTHALKAELQRDWAVQPERIDYIPNGIGLPEDIPAVTPADPPIILCVARLQRQKDHDTLLRAFALVRRTRPCRMQLAGDGRERARLEDLARKLGIAADVEFLGHVSDVAARYRAARLTVLSSRHEGFPNVLIEALAHGCPVVATDCPTGPAEVINGPEVGLLAEVGNPEDLAARIAEALEREFDPALLRQRAAYFSERKLSERIVVLFSRGRHDDRITAGEL